MLRHLGAAYYDALNGRAAPGDVKRAVAEVASQVGDRPTGHVSGPRARASEATGHVPGYEGSGHSAGTPQARAGERRRPVTHHGRWHSRVRDIMTTDVITVDRITSFKEITALLVEHQISGVPVLTLGRHVAGVVTEGDLIAARDKQAGTRRRWTGLLRYGSDHDRHFRLTAQQLMTTPPVTIHPDATIAAAAGLMTRHHVKRLPVTDPDGRLLGIVSRRDLLGVFLVPDEAIGRQVRELLEEIEPGGAAKITVAVRGGVVTLTCAPERVLAPGPTADALDAIWDLDGVVDVIDHLAASRLA
jgi:CBS domain-containing protein